MSRKLFVLLPLTVMLSSSSVFAQDPVVGSMKFLYDDAKRNVIESAEKADASVYAFKPADETRTLAQQLTHIADANYLFCSTSRGVTNPHPGAGPGEQGKLEKTVTKKADIVAAVKASFEFCDVAWGEASDANLGEMVELVTPGGATPVPRASVLALSAYHGGQHYGSIATYLRLNGMVPPSTERSLASSESSDSNQ